MSKYRFKTEEEFKRDGLWIGECPKFWVTVMNKYLGKDIPDSYNTTCDKQDQLHYETWSFNPKDYVLKEAQPEYTVGKWYGSKTWKSKADFVKLERIHDEQAYFRECLIAGVYQKGEQNWWSIVGNGLFEADMSIVSPLLPDGHPDKITAEETVFVLPSKWCIKVNRNCQPEEVYKWRNIYWADAGYICQDKHWNHRVFSSHTEITFEQFKQHVLKESPVVEPIVETLNQEEDYTGRTIKALVISPQDTGVQLGEEIKILIKENKDTYILERTARDFSNMRIDRPLNLSDWELLPESPKEIDMKEIQEEAKKRFPIGCKFIPVDGDDTYTLIEDSYTYTIHSKQIYAHDCHGTLYDNGKWATLVSSPETKKEMFYKGDYIVTLDVEDCYNCARKNYCFKQRINDTGIYPAVDLQGSTGNGHGVMSFGKKEWLKDWRYATPEEAAEYERIGMPYDVTTLQKKEESIPEYIECTSPKDTEPYFIKGNIYKVVKASPISSAELTCNILKDYEEHNILYTRLVDTDGTKLFKPSTKEAYEAQNTSKQLANKDLVKGEIYIYDGSQIAIYPEGPNVDFNGHYISNPKWMWTLPITHATEEQKALLRREIERNTTKTSKSEYIPQVGDYVVMENAGGWGYHPSNNGCIAIVEKISTREVGYGSDRVRVVSIGGQIINAKELNSVRFIDVPIIGHEKKPVFRKALPHELPNGLPKTTVITEWPSDPIVEQKINTLSIKKETFIDNVQSVDVILRTKRKSFKF